MFSLLNKTTINASAAIFVTNSRVGKQYKKCSDDKLCSEVYVCDRIVKCNDCKKIKAI